MYSPVSRVENKVHSSVARVENIVHSSVVKIEDIVYSPVARLFIYYYYTIFIKHLSNKTITLSAVQNT